MRFFSILILLALAATAAANSYSSGGVAGGTESVFRPYPDTGTDNLTYYTDEATFDAAYPGLTTEDFSSTLVPGNSVQSDTGPIDYFCNNTLFALNTVVEGIAIWEQSGADMVVLTPPFLGVTDVVVGPNTFTDHGVIDFTVPTRAFGCFIVMPNGGVPANIEIFGAGGSLGTTTATGATGGGAFWGVFCDSEDITQITFNCADDGGELFSLVRFGLPTALARTSWAGIKTSF